MIVFFPGTKGGGARYVYELALEANKSKKTVQFILNKDIELKSLFDALEITPIYFNGYYKYFPGFLIFDWVKIFFLLFKILRTVDQKVIFSPMTHIFSPATFLVTKLFKATYVLTMHDAVTHEAKGRTYLEVLRKLDEQSAQKIIFLSMNVAKEFGYNSNTDTQLLLAHEAFRPLQISGDVGQDIDLFREHRDYFTLLIFGRIEKYKGISEFLSMLKDQPESWLEYRIIIAGPGDARSISNDISYLSKIGLNINLVNRWIKEEEIPILFEIADTILLTHKRASQTGIIPLAACFGTMVLANNVAGLTEQDQFGNVEFFDINDPSSAANALVNIRMRDPVEKENLKRRMEKLTHSAWKQHWNEIENFCNSDQ